MQLEVRVHQGIGKLFLKPETSAARRERVIDNVFDNSPNRQRNVGKQYANRSIGVEIDFRIQLSKPNEVKAAFKAAKQIRRSQLASSLHVQELFLASCGRTNCLGWNVAMVFASTRCVPPQKKRDDGSI